MLTVLVIANNQKEYVKLVVQSIRLFGVGDMSVILLDNASTDGLCEWAMEQEDLTYAYIDNGKKNLGTLINEVMTEIKPEGDLLIVNGNYLLTPGSIESMLEVLYEEEDVGAVGPMSNGFCAAQRFSGAGNWGEAIDIVGKFNKTMSKRVIGLQEGVVLVKEKVIQELGSFDEKLQSEAYTLKDYFIKMILNEWKIKVCETAVFWDCNEVGKGFEINEKDSGYLEQKWGMHYFISAYNNDLVELIQEDEKKFFAVLEIGCDCGATLLEIKNRYPNAEVYGSEINKNSAKVASFFANVVINNIEDEDLIWADNRFDYIIFGDVLEHLRDPLKTICYCRKLLKEGGHIIASIPNLMHISVVEGILNGNFTYKETGLLDKTHIHMFTYNEICKMFQVGGYCIEYIGGTQQALGEEEKALIDKLTSLGNAETFMYKVYQYIVKAEMI